MSHIISGPYPMAMVRLETAKIGLKFEVDTGMKFCRISAAALCKRELGMKGIKKTLLNSLTAYIDRVKHGEDAVKAHDGRWYTGQDKRPEGFKPDPKTYMSVVSRMAKPEEFAGIAPAKPKTIRRKVQA